jgi:hypothetical protein
MAYFRYWKTRKSDLFLQRYAMPCNLSFMQLIPFANCIFISPNESTFQIQLSMNDLSRFQRIVKLVAFHPFDSAENALENINAITEHEVTNDLREFLGSNLPKGKKSTKSPLGVVSRTNVAKLLHWKTFHNQSNPSLTFNHNRSNRPWPQLSKRILAYHADPTRPYERSSAASACTSPSSSSLWQTAC